MAFFTMAKSGGLGQIATAPGAELTHAKGQPSVRAHDLVEHPWQEERVEDAIVVAVDHETRDRVASEDVPQSGR